MIATAGSQISTVFSAVHSQDSIVVESPLPGGAAAFVRFLFHVPQSIQIIGAIGALIAGVALAALMWRRRVDITTWLLTRSRGVTFALVTAAVVALVAAAGTGTVSWNYMQHDNGFCTGCHIMAPAFERFTASEHDSLSCHDCHQQSIFVSTRQLYHWVLERPEEIPPHAPVPNEICENCHVTDGGEAWQRVASTAGHRTHLESDSTALRDVMCVTCHGVEVHRFVPVDQTCAQSDCHVDTDITLGRMQGQTSLHCVTCHEFTVEVPLLATRDSAAGALTPNVKQCLSCHEMQAVLAEFDVAFDPHSGSCGMCHNPHVQTVATDANTTCASAACHVDWRTEPFHTGLQHGDVGNQCSVCHEPHRARVDASDCVGCHTTVAEREDIPSELRRRLQQALPFDTTRAIGNSPSLRPITMGITSGRDSPLWSDFPLWGIGWGFASQPPSAHTLQDALTIQPDSFSHAQHSDLSCLTCHVSTSGHGQLTFEAPRGCQICHHQAPTEGECASCHAPQDMRAPVLASIRVQTGEHPTHVRDVGFDHGMHQTVQCVSCHVVPVTLAAASPTKNCVDCHGDHHTANRDCVSCHVGDDYYQPHAPPADAHTGCNTCHDPATIETLLPDQLFCLTCHQTQKEHYPDGECTQCHLQASPEEFRGKLTRSGER
ncbi:MAG: hypothetical protein IIB90_06075 [Gemmatimonadetes bacterium]|nr:hypothetical protein [Gemmatimonadota bacterium]